MFYDLFNKLCINKGVTAAQVARDTGINQSTISMWKSQGTTPNAKTLTILAQYFGVTTNYLVGSSSEPFEAQLYKDLQIEAANYYLEQVMLTLGYGIGGNSDGYTWIKDKNTGICYEVTLDEIDKLREQTASFLRFLIQEKIRSAKAITFDENPTGREY